MCEDLPRTLCRRRLSRSGDPTYHRAGSIAAGALMSAKQMQINKSTVATAAALTALTLLCGCSPEIGSDAWCRKMAQKPKSDWSAREAADFARHCVFRRNSDG